MKGTRASQAYDAAMKHAEAERIAEVNATRRGMVGVSAAWKRNSAMAVRTSSSRFAFSCLHCASKMSLFFSSFFVVIVFLGFSRLLKTRDANSLINLHVCKDTSHSIQEFIACRSRFEFDKVKSR